jgi:glycosyltransferase involved in cell wall biosynthesis
MTNSSEKISSNQISRIAICVPVFNDWLSVLQLIDQIEEVGVDSGKSIDIIFIDDGSNEDAPDLIGRVFKSISVIDILQLRRNVGHQRAIALGLCYINANISSDAVVVMDADGEDSPGDLLHLVSRCVELGSSKIVFARRRKRTDGTLFRSGYFAYRVLFLALTGNSINVGNFSVIPGRLIKKVIGISEIWNHYAAGIIHARLPIDTIPLDRRKRLAGKSKMNFVGLVMHGLSAISVYGDVVGARVLCVTTFLTCIVGVGIFAVLFIKFLTDIAIPGWATAALGLLTVILLNLLGIAAIFVLFILNTRQMTGFLPERDWENYVASRIIAYRK